jgi:arsenate reductase
MNDVEIWHNPGCSKSRAALELLKARGLTPAVVLYLETPPTEARISEILGLLGVEPRALMRRGESMYRELALDAPNVEREALLQAMVYHPELIERPVVIRGEKAVIARPPERALEVL